MPRATSSGFAAEAIRIAGRLSASRADGVACDVATREGTDALIEAVKTAHGGADILINNAGSGSNETVMEAADDKWQAYWELHVMAAVRLARGLAPLMKARGGGVILHNASICAVQPLWYEPIYNTTKAALMMFSKCLATELVGDNIRVNCVNPGLVLTPDWIKTAKQLTAETGRRLAGLSGRRRARIRADQALRDAGGGREYVRLSLFRTRELLGRLDILRRRRLAEDRSSAGSTRPSHQWVALSAFLAASAASWIWLITPTTPGTFLASASAHER